MKDHAAHERQIAHARKKFVDATAAVPDSKIFFGNALIIVGDDYLIGGRQVAERIRGALMAVAHVNGDDPGLMIHSNMLVKDDEIFCCHPEATAEGSLSNSPYNDR